MDYVFGRASDLVIGRISVCSSVASILRQYQEHMGFGEQQPLRFLHLINWTDWKDEKRWNSILVSRVALGRSKSIGDEDTSKFRTGRSLRWGRRLRSRNTGFFYF